MCGRGSEVAGARRPRSRALLYQLAEQSLAGDTMMASAIFAEAEEYIAVGKTTYHTRLRRLADAGIIDLLWTRKGHEVFLRYSPDEVFAACARAGDHFSVDNVDDLNEEAL